VLIIGVSDFQSSQTIMRRWFDDGLRIKATHMIIKCDEFDWTYCPEYVYSKKEACTRVIESVCHGEARMERMKEVYLLDSARKEEQLNNRSNMNFC
jgi:hypothetical protein